MKEKLQVNKKHYDFLNYVTIERFNSVYYQLKLIMEADGSSLLEIGPGNNLIKKVIGDKIIVKTVDIDPELEPDYMASVTQLPLKDNSFDVVCAFQILEHIPFEKFEPALKEIARVSRKYTLLSLPYCMKMLKCEIKVKGLLEKQFLFTLPKFYKEFKFDGQHYWEVGSKGLSKMKIQKIIEKFFDIEENFNPYENPYHIFYKLKRKKHIHNGK